MERPILVGAGQTLDRPAALEDALSPLDMMQLTSVRAAEDAGLTGKALQEVERLIVVNSVGRTVRNPCEALAKRLGADKAEQLLTVTGGNTPQLLVNHSAEAIARGEVSMVLLAGAEALDSVLKARRLETNLNWDEPGGLSDPVLFSTEKTPTNETESAHGLFHPINAYPLFENALRHHYGRSFAQHQQALGELLAPFTEIAAHNPYAWFPIQRSADEIATVSSDNRYIGFPYTKYMNAIIRVNQSAAVLMMSETKARELGIDESRWVYLHGCADVNDLWYMTDRLDFHSSPGIRAGGELALNMAKMGIDEVDYFDLYSCFPSVVQIARDELGITADDSRPLTVTGGLPYHGGPGNNYVMHSVASMMKRLRDEPERVGMLTGNGWYVTKHSLGVYSTRRPEMQFVREDPDILQSVIDAQTHPRLESSPTGKGTIETYTVLFGRDGSPERGVVIGRLQGGDRFVAHTPSDQDVLEQMMQEDPIGLTGRVASGETNQFDFD
jgi:acetyl-CoA C-acetyltransferase